jgi:hypothetical protein
VGRIDHCTFLRWTGPWPRSQEQAGCSRLPWFARELLATHLLIYRRVRVYPHLHCIASLKRRGVVREMHRHLPEGQVVERRGRVEQSAKPPDVCITFASIDLPDGEGGNHDA